MIKNCRDFYIITVGDSDFTGDLFKLLEKKLDFHRWISYTFEEADLRARNVERMKIEIRKQLKSREWIK
jgi:hypothetical protein